MCICTMQALAKMMHCSNAAVRKLALQAAASTSMLSGHAAFSLMLLAAGKLSEAPSVTVDVHHVHDPQVLRPTESVTVHHYRVR